MTVTAHRVTKQKYAATAFDGEGARLFGGRWNSKGVPMIYVAGSLSLATLEILVHLENHEIFNHQFIRIEVSFPSALIEVVSVEKLRAGWDSPEISPITQMLGDQWVKGNRSAVLQVPTLVTPGEFNFLLNPAHSDYGKISIGEPLSFEPDSRLAAT